MALGRIVAPKPNEVADSTSSLFHLILRIRINHNGRVGMDRTTPPGEGDGPPTPPLLHGNEAPSFPGETMRRHILSQR